MWPDGLVALTHAFRLVALLSFAHPRIVPLALTLTLTSSPSTVPTRNLLTLASPEPELRALASSPSA